MILRELGHIAYQPAFDAMKDFTAHRSAQTADELWLCEHPPVYTQGLAGRAEHLLHDIGIPVVQIDRGGQITYHGPGQVIVYLLLDLRRHALKIRELVQTMEQAVIDLLHEYGIQAERHAGAPGVYVGDAKIAALGLRVKGGCTYHGLALNVDMDLRPYQAINPCGYAGLRVTQMRELCAETDTQKVGRSLAQHLIFQIERHSRWNPA